MEQKQQAVIPIKLPSQLKEDLDELVRLGVFASRSEAIKFGIRLLIMMEKSQLPLSKRAEEYAYEEIKEKFERVKNVRRR